MSSTVGEYDASGVALWRPGGTEVEGQAKLRPGGASYTMRRGFGFILQHLVSLFVKDCSRGFTFFGIGYSEPYS